MSTKPSGRTEILRDGPGGCEARLTMPIDYTDGFRVTVGWSREDASWVARCEGMRSFSPGNAMGMGDTQVAALLDLCCALAATVDSMGEPDADSR